MPYLDRDGLRLSYRDTGSGSPLVLQHGLGGDAAQPVGVAPPNVRLITLECRGHGESDIGAPRDLSFATFTQDLRVLLDHLDIERAIVGGISMGAGLALRLAYDQPDSVVGLVLVRPAWSDRPNPPNLAPLLEVARYLRDFGPAEGKRRYQTASKLLAVTHHESLSAAQSLLGQFDRPLASARAPVLERMVADAPLPLSADWSRLRMPALILATRGDPLHPFSMARQLASALPKSRLTEIAGKDSGLEAHARMIVAAIGEFARRGIPRSETRRGSEYLSDRNKKR